MRKFLTTILRKIIRARQVHTSRFKAGQFDQMRNKDAATAVLWDEFTLTADGLRRGHQCFNCNKQSNGLAYVFPCGHSETTLYFCSETCEQSFKELLRQA